LASKTSPIEKYIYLSNLRNNNVHLFYRLVMGNLTVCVCIFGMPRDVSDVGPGPNALDLHACCWRSVFEMVTDICTS